MSESLDLPTGSQSGAQDTLKDMMVEAALQLAGSPAPPNAYATRAAPIPPAPAPPKRPPPKRPEPPGPASAPRAPKRVFNSPFTVFCKEQRPLVPPMINHADRERLLGVLNSALGTRSLITALALTVALAIALT